MSKHFLKTAFERGYIKDLTNENGIKEYSNIGNMPIYIGFDCTAPSIHIGSLVQIMLLRLWQKFNNNKVIVILGGGTTKVGDPSGKDKSRQSLSEETILFNIIKIQKIFEQFLNFDNNQTKILNNADWLDNIKYIEFLRSYGSHFSVNKMLTLESIKQRLAREQELSFIEFNYVLMQSYDFVRLNIDHGCRLQAGGSDQWGNIVNGIELNRKLGNKQCYGITTPLLTTSTGEKMGKTANGAIWLSEEMLPVYDYWQYFRNINDTDIGRFFRLFTEMPISKIEELESSSDKNINEVKKILATEVTAICHGRKKAEEAQRIAENMFESQKSNELLTFKITNTNKMHLKHIICSVGFASSATEAKSFIKSNAVTINNNIVNDETYMIKQEQLPLTLSVGKKKKIQLIK